MKKASSNMFMFAKVYRPMTSGRQGAPYFRRYGRELVSKPAISSKRKVGGASVERLCCVPAVTANDHRVQKYSNDTVLASGQLRVGTVTFHHARHAGHAQRDIPKQLGIPSTVCSVSAQH